MPAEPVPPRTWSPAMDLPSAAAAGMPYHIRRKTEDRINRYGRFSPVLRTGWIETERHSGYVAANHRLREMAGRLRRADLNLSMDDDELRAWCKAKAETCRRLLADMTRPAAIAEIKRRLALYGLEWPEPVQRDLVDPEGPALERVKCERWWRLKVRRRQARALEGIARDLRIVHAGKQPYASNYTVSARQEQKTRNRTLLEEMQAVNDAGQEYTLAELADLSTSNPALRRGELMTRIAGFEQVALERGLVGEFYTISAPSKYHPSRTIYNPKTGKVLKVIPNDKYNGASVREVQDYFCSLWARIRAALGRAGIGVFGFRVVEPHHDGCPHWHLLLFMPGGACADVRRIMAAYALQEDASEVGAQKHRFKAESIDRERGSAAGYIAKYIAKNIDGHGLDECGGDLFGGDSIHTAARVDAWAATHGVRQFQQIGGPSVTVWRELRRLEVPEDGEVEPIREAADAANWAAFVELMGGPFCGRDGQAVRVARWHEFDPGTGEIIDPLTNRYGEPNAGRIMGVVYLGATYICTRFYRWAITRVRAAGEATRQWMAEAGKAGPPPLESCQ